MEEAVTVKRGTLFLWGVIGFFAGMIFMFMLALLAIVGWYRMEDETIFIGFLCFIIGMILTGVIATAITVDKININKLGDSMCTEHNLSYDYFETDNTVGIKIYCKQDES